MKTGFIIPIRCPGRIATAFLCAIAALVFISPALPQDSSADGRDRKIEKQNKELQRRIDEAVNEGRIKFGQSMKGIIDQLGRPTRTGIDAMPNPHTTARERMTIYILYYPGLEFRILKAFQGTPAEKDIILHVELSRESYKLKGTLCVGVSKNAVRDYLGNPGLETKEHDQYVENEEYVMPASVAFYYNNDKVTKIMWSYPVD